MDNSPHVTKGEAVVERGQVIYPISRKQSAAKLGFES